MRSHSDPTRRFSDRVENYVKYRPGYPAEVYDYLRAEAGLHAGDLVADLGSGTGLSSRLFLERGHSVIGIEPNAEMRAAAERELAGEANFASVAGTAEAIPMRAGSADLVAAGQAFHWFKEDAARREMARVLKPGGQAALIWNMRNVQGSRFQRAYEEMLLEFGTDFKQVDQQRNFPQERLTAFFAPQAMHQARFANEQRFDLAGLRGRLLSSSYAPREGEAGYAPMLARLEQLFSQHQQAGAVIFAYVVEVYHGALGA